MLEGIPRQIFLTLQPASQTQESAIQQNELVLQSKIKEIPTFNDLLLGVLALRRFIVVVNKFLQDS